MTPHWITECPHCSTSFRVTEQHLRAARGSVRCGSCLQIFNAINTLFPEDHHTQASIDSDPATVPPAQSEKEVISEQEEVPTTSESATDATPLRVNPIIEAFANGGVSYEPPSQSREQWEIEQLEANNDAFVWSDNELETPYLESPALDTPHIETPDLETPTFENPSTHWHSSYSELNSSEWSTRNTDRPTSPEEKVFAPDYPDNEKIEPPFDERDWSLDDDEQVIQPHSQQTAALADETVASDSGLYVDPAECSEHFDQETLAHSSHVHDVRRSGFDGAEHEPHIGSYREPFRDALLSELEMEPPLSAIPWEKHHQTGIWKWGVLCIILLVALGTQYILFNYNRFAPMLESLGLRSVVEHSCEYISCRFIKTDLSLVANENLVIRAHPTESGYLVLDTLLVNKAPYTQPFPQLDLRFSDMKNNVIAWRRFQPDEYLTGELTHLTDMPINTPIHISFAIKNPSDLASNYELRLIPSSR